MHKINPAFRPTSFAVIFITFSPYVLTKHTAPWRSVKWRTSNATGNAAALGTEERREDAICR